MADTQEVTDRILEALQRAENGAKIYHDSANGPVGSTVPTESGPLPTLAELQRIYGAALGGQNVLSFGSLQGVANRLPYFNGPGSLALSVLSPFIRSALGSADAPATANALGFASETPASSGASLIGGAVQSVSTLSELRSLKKTSASKYVVMGPSFYFLDLNNTTSADNFPLVVVATDGGRWILNHPGFITLRQAGAKGDGITDDSAAIQRAFDSLPADGSLVCRPGAGRFVHNTGIVINGKSVLILGEGDGTVFVYKGTGIGIDIAPGDILRQVTIKDIVQEAGNPTAPSGRPLRIKWPTTPSWSQKTLLMENVQVKSSLTGSDLPYWGQGLELANAWNGRIINYWDNGRANTYNVGEGITLGENCTDLIIQNPHIFFRGTGILATGYSEGIQVIDPVIVAVNRGFWNTSQNMLGPRITNGHINAGLICIDLNAVNQAQITNCLLYNAVGSAAVATIQMTDCSDNQVIGNHCLTATSTSNGVIVLNSIGTSANNKIYDNEFYGHANGVWLKTGSTGNKVRGNSRRVSGAEVSAVLDQGTGNIIGRRTASGTVIKALTGGAATETVFVDIAANQLLAKPQAAQLLMAGGDATNALMASYDFDNASNTATRAYFKVFRRDGSAIGSGNYRFSYFFSD